MVAYSYKKRFVVPVRVGLGLDTEADVRPKRQTIRADRPRHARPGEEIQHYCGMRTKSCFLIGRSRCASTEEIHMCVNAGRIITAPYTTGATWISKPKQLDEFAESDGFGDWYDMREFWRSEHPEITDLFIGVIIKWSSP